MIFCGIDNGTSGSVVMMNEYGEILLSLRIPTVLEDDYNSVKNRKIRRVDYKKFKKLIDSYSPDYIMIERPFKNPMMFDASISSVRAFESMLIAIDNRFPTEVIDSKRWQKKYFPEKKKGEKVDLKKLSVEIGKKKFPLLSEWKGDYDGFFIALYCLEELEGSLKTRRKK